ncbi:uncharacterized protein LOC135842093 [Planococcus citri]|uniref:uncharacterized protein LOC135842093 n=1 Tax=Planococcus citri TaxID=170843 RepID=UPI0031FA3ACB
MNFSRNLLTTLLSIFILFEDSISKEVFVYRDIDTAPLALIKKRNSPSWERAIPHKSPNKDTEAGYFYDDPEDEEGRKDEFKIACPSFGDQQKETEKKWRESDKLFKESQLFFIKNYESVHRICRDHAKPSIRKSINDVGKPINCGKSGAEFYEVGYPVSLNEQNAYNIEFIPIYKICHSGAPGVGTQYTIHEITSPDLMMLKYRKSYYIDPSKAFQSYLDDCPDCAAEFYKAKNRYIVHQFVGIYDMPTRLWQWTTMFRFNFIQLSISDKDLLRGLQRADQFIQLFSRKTNKPLTLYSGIIETKSKGITSTFCTAVHCGKNFIVKLFWRIITDAENNAIILITQLTRNDCKQTNNIRVICQNDEDRVMLEYYNDGGCMYKCPVTDTIISELGLPTGLLGLKIDGVLSLDFDIPEEESNNLRRAGGSSDTNAESAAQHIGISDFMGDAAGFAVAVAAVDAGLAAIMQAEAAAEGAADGAADGNGGNDGNGEGSGNNGGSNGPDGE